MYKLVEAKLILLDISKRRLSEKLGISYNTLLLKLKHKSPFTLDEALAIKKILSADEPIEALFEVPFTA